MLFQLLMLICAAGIPTATAFHKFSLAIYTPKGETFRVISLKEDWTFETKDKQGYSQYERLPTEIKKFRKPHLLTGVLEFENSLESRSFWIDVQPVGSPPRHMLKVSFRVLVRADQNSVQPPFRWR